MATINNVIKGLEIFKKYMNDGEGEIGAADNDEIWFCPDDVEIQDADQVKLRELGFTFHKDGGWMLFV